MKRLLFLLFLFSTSLVLGQDIATARKVIDTLTSRYFSGRGAINDGEKKAAQFIATRFQSYGLKPIKDSYIQAFNFPINTFPGKISVALDSVPLIPGKDFLIGPASAKINGTFKLICYHKENVPTPKELKKLASRNFFSGKFIVIDDAGVTKENEAFHLLKLNVLGAEGIVIIAREKLTHSLSTTHEEFGIVIVKEEKISRLNKTITLHISQKFIRNYSSQNVIGCVKGSTHPDSIVILSAHYDHLGTMGPDVYFPGANDNASGVAMLLNLAHHFSHKAPPKKTIIFIAFGAEEAGLIGSKYFVDHPPIDLGDINFVFNMDLMGTGSEGAMIVNGAVYKQQFEHLQAINAEQHYLSIIKKRGKAANSDHYWFSEKGVPSFFMYTLGGIKAYHDVQDIAITLPLTKYEDSFRLIRDFVTEL